MRMHFNHALAPLQYHFPILMNVRLQFGKEKRTKNGPGARPSSRDKRRTNPVRGFPASVHSQQRARASGDKAQLNQNPCRETKWPRGNAGPIRGLNRPAQRVPDSYAVEVSNQRHACR